jgi:hypothetical protein
MLTDNVHKCSFHFTRVMWFKGAFAARRSISKECLLLGHYKLTNFTYLFSVLTSEPHRTNQVFNFTSEL